MVTIVEPHPNEQSKLVDRYLVRYGGSNTSTQNLWDALDGEDFSNGEVGRRVTEVMDTWTKQQGFPWVRVGSFFIYVYTPVWILIRFNPDPGSALGVLAFVMRTRARNRLSFRFPTLLSIPSLFRVIFLYFSNLYCHF